MLLNRDTVLTEMTPQAFAAEHGWRLLADDNVAVSQALAFRVETFTPTETFQPRKAYLTRLKWRDHDGNEQSKLLVTPPETVVGNFRCGGPSRRHGPKDCRGGRSGRAGDRARSTLFAASEALFWRLLRVGLVGFMQAARRTETTGCGVIDRNVWQSSGAGVDSLFASDICLFWADQWLAFVRREQR